MKTLFIADLHLRKEEKTITAGFLSFLRREAVTADALYILGDLFEAWIGDDDLSPLNNKVASFIKMLVNSNVPCYFIHGNRDFLIGKKFAFKSGLILLPEEKILNLYGRKILVMHGDTLCTNDKKYQLFRTGIRRSWIRKSFLSMPLFIRSRIVEKVRAKSKDINFKKRPFIMDINPKAAVEVMEKYHVQWLICGHIHRPNTYEFIANGQPAFCVVLGAWQKNKGSVVKVTRKCVELLHFPFN